MVILLLTPIYWVIFLIVLFKGMFNAASKDAEKKKSGINQLIVAAVMLVIGDWCLQLGAFWFKRNALI